MSDTFSSTTPLAENYPPRGDDTSDAGREQASQPGARETLGTAKEETKKVASEAKSQAADLLQQTRDELAGQAQTQQQRVAGGLRSLSEELGTMADGAQGGVASDLVGRVSARASDVAGWLEQREPGDLVDEVREFARRRPGAFIAIAAGAGLLVGRLTRSVVSSSKEQTAETSTPTQTPTSTLPTTTSTTGIAPTGATGSAPAGEALP